MSSRYIPEGAFFDENRPGPQYAEKLRDHLAKEMDLNLLIAMSSRELRDEVARITREIVDTHYKEAIETAIKAAAPQLKTLMMNALKEKIENVVDRAFPDDDY